MTIHYVNTGTFTVDANGDRIDKTSSTTTIATMRSTSMAALVIPADDVPNSAGYPTIKEYLKAEAVSGYKLYHLDQNIIITYDA
jgi:hypothetical protein